jgi:hypothetical protein
MTAIGALRKRPSSSPAPEGLRNCAVIIDHAGFGKGTSIIASPIDPATLEG